MDILNGGSQPLQMYWMALDLWLVPDTVFLGKVGVNHYLLKTRTSGSVQFNHPTSTFQSQASWEDGGRSSDLCDLKLPDPQLTFLEFDHFTPFLCKKKAGLYQDLLYLSSSMHLVSSWCSGTD